MSRTAIAVSAFGLLVATAPINAAIINVGPGQSIQTAINGANNDDEIVVAPGTYIGALDTNDKSITIRSSGGPNVTIINGNNAGPCISIDDTNGMNNPTVIEGFTLTNGRGVANGLGGFQGAGIYAWLTNPTIRNCIIRNNSVVGTSSQGGGVYCFFASPRLINCTIRNNSATQFGGGIYGASSSAPFLVNCSVISNTAVQGGGIYSNNSSPRLISCIVFNNNDDSLAGGGIVTYSNISGGFAGEGNINLNPQFVNLGAGDLHLTNISPCIDAGDSTSIANEWSKDLDLNPRGVDDPNKVDTGKQVFGLVVDMGSYEFQVPCAGGPASCVGDLTNSGGTGTDGIVDVFDLFALLSAWGACPP